MQKVENICLPDEKSIKKEEKPFDFSSVVAGGGLIFRIFGDPYPHPNVLNRRFFPGIFHNCRESGDRHHLIVVIIYEF